MLFEESGISPEIVADRGYRTVRSRAELPEFKKYQRRAPALYVPMYSPDGATTGAQLRPDNPRRDRKGRPIKYETAGGSRASLDVHPWMAEQVRRGSGDLLVVEGVKKGDALASRGECAISLIGVWNWQRHGQPLPCWDHVALEGRRVFVAFDSDLMENGNIQLALEGLVAMLEKRGADVWVVYLPGGRAGEPQVGVDDYLAAGATVAELKALARRFEPGDLASVRLSRDEALRAAVEGLWSSWWAFDWSRMVGTGERPNSMRGHTARDVMKALIDAAARSGRVRGDFLEVRIPSRTLALAASTSRPSVGKALRNLEADGLVEIVSPGKAAEKARVYRLPTGRATLYQLGGGTGDEEKVTPLLRTCDPGGKPLRAPRLRWSSPGRKAQRGLDKETRRVRDNVQPAVEGFKRLGKIRGAVVDALDGAGGELTLQALCEVLHRSRRRDLRRRVLPMLEESGILAVEDQTVRLASDWRARLDEARQLGGEIERESLERERHRMEREAFRRRKENPPDHHFANDVLRAGADGWMEDLVKLTADQEVETPAAEISVSPLARAVRDYLEKNPHDACQRPSWLGVTLWAFELVAGKKPAPAEIETALEELGGEAYRRELLASARAA